jgi:hypothetical protein
MTEIVLIQLDQLKPDRYSLKSTGQIMT